MTLFCLCSGDFLPFSLDHLPGYMLPKKSVVESLVAFFLSFLMIKEKGIISTCLNFSADLPRKPWEITFSACMSGKGSLNACLR